jgi:ATP-binding cassette, subfamily F, member 1
MPKKQKQSKKNDKSIKHDDIDASGDASIDSFDDSSKNIYVYNLILTVSGKTLLFETPLSIEHGGRYGLVGINGSGKSTLLKHIYEKKFRIPSCIDMFMLEQEIEVSDTQSVFDMVISSNHRRNFVKNQIDLLDKKLDSGDEIPDEEMVDIMNKIEAYENEWTVNQWDKDPSIISKILIGLGFSDEEQKKATATFSGGWRMRISLARALYLKPTLLLLDEPTNHLDLDAVIWLTDYLSNQWKNTLIVVSHNIHFLDSICNHIIQIYDKKLRHFNTNYHGFKIAFEQIFREKEKEWNKVESEVKAKQAKSLPKHEIKEFIESKHREGIFRPPKPYKVEIIFNDVSHIDGNLIELNNISFSYDSHSIFESLSLTITHNSRYAIIGHNGVGKSTLLKILNRDIEIPYIDDSTNITRFNPRASIGYFSQHSKELLPHDITPVDYLNELALKYFSDEDPTKITRRFLGMIGLESEAHNHKIHTLSGGQKARVILASLQIINPHILLLDEPTNHLDIETIDALILGINNFNGAVVIVSHDESLINGIDDIITMHIHDKIITSVDYDEYVDKIVNPDIKEDIDYSQYNITKHKP